MDGGCSSVVESLGSIPSTSSKTKKTTVITFKLTAEKEYKHAEKNVQLLYQNGQNS